jgi:uncharacterized protein (DUF1330 family)
MPARRHHRHAANADGRRWSRDPTSASAIDHTRSNHVAAYLLANIDVTDRDGYDEYRKRVPATIAAYGGRYLTRAGATEILEGEWVPKRLVILEFPSMAVLKAWYDCPEYRPLREIRERNATSSIVAIDGIAGNAP